MSAGLSDAMRVSTDLQDIAAKHGLRHVQALTDTHKVVVEEPSMWSTDHRLKVTIKELET